MIVIYCIIVIMLLSSRHIISGEFQNTRQLYYYNYYYDIIAVRTQRLFQHIRDDNILRLISH